MEHDTSVFVFVEIDGKRFGTPASAVREVLPMLEPTRMPNWPADVLGLMDIRGELIPLVDIAPKLGKPPCRLTPKQYIVLVNAHGREWGVVVDRVVGVRQAVVRGADEVGGEHGIDMPAVCLGVTFDEDRMVVLLDPEHLIDSIRIPLTVPPGRKA